MTDQYARRTGDDYADAFARLFPTGPAWPQDEQTVFQRLIRALAQIFGYVDERAGVLLQVEGDPRRAYETLAEWERAFSLPDPCVPSPLTLPERRQALVNKMTSEGGQSRAFFIAVAAALGYQITITEYLPFQFGLSSFGGSHGAFQGPQARFFWTVTIPDLRFTRFRFGASSFGRDSFLSIVRAEDIECVFSRWKPAHTIVLFDYQGA